MDVVYFIVMVGVLVFVHELGHFAWAKFFGVRVLRFSLGFGPRIVGFRRAGTEYVLAAIPLGGYVKMLGESPGDEVRPEDLVGSFGAQPLWKRFVIVVAGPLMNLAFPLVLYTVVFLGDTHLTAPVIGTVFPDQPADGLLMPGDRVLAVDGDEVETFDDVSDRIAGRAGQPVTLRIQRGDQTLDVTLTPALVQHPRFPVLDVMAQVGRIGVSPRHPVAVIGVPNPGSPAGAARLRTFDVVIAAAGKPVHRLIDLEAAAARHRSLLTLSYLRPVRVEGALGGLADLEVFEPHVALVSPDPSPAAAALSPLERAGLESAALYVADVRAGSPEHALGLRRGDRLVALDGRPLRAWETFVRDLAAGRDREHELVWSRNGQEMRGRFRLGVQRGVDASGQPFERHASGLVRWMPTVLDPPVPNPRPFRYAVSQAVRHTSDFVALTFYSFIRLLQGRLSARNIGGPISVFEAAGEAAREGALDFLALMAFISINLALINLLPIPLLDGGHLLFFAIEATIRRPVTRRVREISSLVGLLFLLGLLVLAFTNDLQRQWPRILESVASDVR
jgi:regulator of sigma E protease